MGTFSSLKRHTGQWLSVWFPVVVCVSVIAVETTHVMSSAHTSGVFRAVWTALFGTVSEERWDTIHHVIRKTGHFTGYGLTALAWARAWMMHWKHWFRVPQRRAVWAMAMALCCTAGIASLDELHQSFMPDRTGQVSDVLLDCTGATVFLIVLWGVLRQRGRWSSYS